MTPAQRLGARIRTLRQFYGLSQEHVGRLLKLHQAAICRIELGEQEISAVQLEVLRAGFDPQLTLGEFFEVVDGEYEDEREGE